MRYLKAVGLVVLGGVAMMIGAGGAWGSALTQAPPYTGIVKAESEGTIEMDGAVELECQKSTLEWQVEEHGVSVATQGPLGAFTLEECGSNTVTVFNRGRLELHATSGGNGTMTWSNAEITVQLHRVIFFVPITTHCIYKPENTDIGTFTGSATTKGTARLDIGMSQIPLKATDEACGGSPSLTGSYKFTSPDYLVVD